MERAGARVVGVVEGGGAAACEVQGAGGGVSDALGVIHVREGVTAGGAVCVGGRGLLVGRRSGRISSPPLTLQQLILITPPPLQERENVSVDEIKTRFLQLYPHFEHISKTTIYRTLERGKVTHIPHPRAEQNKPIDRKVV